MGEGAREMQAVAIAALIVWKVWFDAGSGLDIYHSARYSWADVPDRPGVQIILVCESERYRRIVRGADWYWWEDDYGPVAGRQTNTAPRLPLPASKHGLKRGLTIDDAVFESYRMSALGDKQCSE